MQFVKNLVIVGLFSFVVVSMIFIGVTIIEAKEKVEIETTVLLEADTNSRD